ncbi:MAG: helix-turn-helix transcriptional regulator, partial [Gammaproteobacteria bacterium]
MKRNILGPRIRERRRELGVTQADMARQVEISASYLNLIEHNKRDIGGALLRK